MKGILIIVSVLAMAPIMAGCGSEDAAVSGSDDRLSIETLLSDSMYNPYEVHLDSAPDEGCVKLRVRNIGQLRKVFNDSNHVHLAEAVKLGTGIIHDIDEAWRLERPLVEIKSCREYYVDRLTHSYPYLVPEAADLLGEIGRRFNDSLDARGGGNYRIKVTSVMRTPATVKRLRRVNRNASDSSAHQFGTTFDISYSRFICDSISVNRSFEDLKNLLGEILYDLREEGRCYVKFERRQSCFHITTRE